MATAQRFSSTIGNQLQESSVDLTPLSQILAGLITYLLLAIYCYDQHKEKVSIKRVRQLRIQIQNELHDSVFSTDSNAESLQNFKEQNDWRLYAKT